jgi:two-component system chemotaxis response regulator CheB
MSTLPSSSNKIRIILADDSSTMRKMISQKLASIPAFDIIGTAADGQEAIDLYKKLKPDFIIIDVFMPEVDGIEALEEIRKFDPEARVFVYSAIAKKHVGDVFRQITQLGAIDFFEKPSSASEVQGFLKSIADSIQQISIHIKPEVVSTVAKSGTLAPSQITPSTLISDEKIELRPYPTMSFLPKVLAIGSSTGGPQALQAVLSPLRGKVHLPIIITQHMPPSFTGILAKQLNDDTGILTKEAEEGDILKPGHAYLAPGDYHMKFERKTDNNVVVRLNQEPQINFCRPAVDPMIDSANACFPAGVLGVILTGMGSDGHKACERLVKSNRNLLIAQDKKTSTVWGMPAAVAKAGLCHEVLPLDAIPHKILTLLGH